MTTTPIQAQLLALTTAVVGLLLTQGLITNNTEKAITGIASILIPLGWQIADAIIRHGRARVVAAAIASPKDTASEIAAAKAAVRR
jgi:hypothetical protein